MSAMPRKPTFGALGATVVIIPDALNNLPFLVGASSDYVMTMSLRCLV